MAAVPLPVGGVPLGPPAPGQEFLLLPDPVDAVLNHGGVGDNPLPDRPERPVAEKKKICKNPSSLEDLCVMGYLKYLENEIVTYISLTQSKSHLVKGVAKRMLQILKDDINGRLTGLASSVLREKMVSLILSEKFPSIEHCNIYVPEKKDDVDVDPNDENEMIIPTCPNICCTGAFVQEGMMGVIMSAEVRQLIFTSDRVQSRRQFPGTLEFNVPVVLTHLLGATDGKVSQLERLVFSENFVKEEVEDGVVKSKLPMIDQSDKQALFSRHFGQGNIYDTPDRRGIAVDLLILFRDIHPKGGQFCKLTELVLKNNIQCKLYSKANFQFEFLARIGFCCPKLRVFDVFGTDTWADCLVALFFRDAFHSLHRYLYFMENEDDECSEYHPHDTSRYCQFCFDQWHPNQIERPYTNNPVIPLLDSVYDHVIKRYPKRSYCILRNCVRVSDLLKSTGDTVFELVRPPRAPSCQVCHPQPAVDPLDISNQGIKGRLRTKKGSNSSRVVGGAAKVGAGCVCSNTCCSYSGSTGGVVGPGSGPVRAGNRRSLRSSDIASTSGGGVFANNLMGSEGQGGSKLGGEKRKKSSERWVFASRSPEKVVTVGGNNRSVSKSREILSLLGETAVGGGDGEGVMTRARKRSLIKGGRGERGVGETVVKKCKMERFGNKYERGVRLRGGSAYRRSNKGGGLGDKEKGEGEKVESGDRGVPGDGLIAHTDWEKESQDRLAKFPATTCHHGPGVPSGSKYCDHHDLWFEPESISYREVVGYPHLNQCVNSLEILNIGGSNVLGEFLPFLLLHTPKLKSLGQWLNTMIYGLEILKDLPGYENYQNTQLQEFSYSSDRNYFCQPYIGFVPESQEFKNVRREMVRYSNKSAKRIGHKARLHASKRKQIQDDVELMVTSCPNLRKVNLVVHYKIPVLEDTHGSVWEPLLRLQNLIELDLVTMKFENVRSLLVVVGPRLQKLTVECDEEQGNGSEIVHLARNCPNISSLRILLGDKILRGEMTLHFGQTFFRKLERLTVEGNVHLHGFAFLWGHCQALKYIRIGLVVSNELTNTNVLIQDVFTLLFQVNKMICLEEMHIRNLKVRSLAMATLLLDNLPNLKKASNWFLDLYGEDMAAFKRHVKKYKVKGLQIDYKEW